MKNFNHCPLHTAHYVLPFPAVAADQFHKLARSEIFGDYAFWRARDSDQALFGLSSNWENQATADGQLIAEGFRRLGGGGGDQNCAVGREFIPAVCAVETFDRGVVYAQTPESG